MTYPANVMRPGWPLGVNDPAMTTSGRAAQDRVKEAMQKAEENQYQKDLDFFNRETSGLAGSMGMGSRIEDMRDVRDANAFYTSMNTLDVKPMTLTPEQISTGQDKSWELIEREALNTPTQFTAGQNFNVVSNPNLNSWENALHKFDTVDTKGFTSGSDIAAPSGFLSGLKSTLGDRDLMSGIVGGAGLVMEGLAAYQNHKLMKEQLKDMKYNRSVAEEARNRHTANLEGLGKVGASWSNKGTA